MDTVLTDGARQLYADNLFETVKRCYNEATKDYLQKQLKIASEYLTLEQRKELAQKGIFIVS